MKYLVMILGLLCPTAYADEVTLHFGGWSKHFNNHHEYNEYHRTKGVEYGGWLVGTYLNSHHRQGHFLVKNFEQGSGWFKYGASVGAVSGYKKGELRLNCGGICPVVLPYMKAEYQGVGVKLTYFYDGAMASVYIKF